MRANGATVAWEADAQHGRWHDTTTLARLGLVGPTVFMAVALLLPAVSEYSLVGDTISELAIGRFGMMQTITFFVAALSSLALTVALQRLLPKTPGVRIGIGLLALWSLCLAIDGIFPIDPLIPGIAQSSTSLVHLGAALTAFICVLLSIFLLSFGFRRIEGWQHFAPWSFTLGVLALAAFFLPSEGGRAGLYQRIFVGIVMLWLWLVAVRLRNLAAQRSIAGLQR
ncbi:MAG TPA: DUF998 domain-containing protein [Thermomicrobiales bacterium]